MDPKTLRPGALAVSFDVRDRTTCKFLQVQLFVIISFISYTATLLYLPRLKGLFIPSQHSITTTITSSPIAHINNTSTLPSDPSTIEAPYNHIQSTALLCGDVWLALSLMAGTDAFWVVATFNHTLMKNWHYFVSLRMMALASILSFCLYIPSNWGKSTTRLQDYSFALSLSCLAYFLFNYALSRLHRRPPSTTANSHFGSIHLYSDKMSRFSFGWGRALHVSAVICAFPSALTIIMPSGWVTIIPLLTIPFEVNIIQILMSTK